MFTKVNNFFVRVLLRLFVKSNFDNIPEPCKIEVLFPEGYKPTVSLRCSGFCRLSFPGLSSNTYDILPGERFSISFIED